jgi:hypothetical protein
MPFKPTSILEDLSNSNLDKPSALELLMTINDNFDEIQTRLESINVIQIIK